MIKAVQDWFEKEIIKSNMRGTFDASFEHTLHIKLDNIHTITYNAFCDAYNDIDPTLLGTPFNVKGTTKTHQQHLYDEIWIGIDKEYEFNVFKNGIKYEQGMRWKGKGKGEHSRLGVGHKSMDVGVRITKDGKRGVKWTESGTGANRIVTLEFDIGVIAKKTLKAFDKTLQKKLNDKEKGVSGVKSVVNAMLRNRYTQMTEHVVKKSAYSTNLRKEARAIRVKHQKTHGETEENITGDEMIAKTSDGTPTTIAILQLAKNMASGDVLNQVVKAGLKVEGTGTAVDNAVAQETVKAIFGALSLHYELEDFIDASSKGLKSDINIILELLGDQAAMRHYDVGGIKEYLRSIQADIITEVKKHVKDIAELEGSASRRRLMEQQAKRMVIIEMVGAMKKAYPDLRLKVNRDLLKEAQAGAKGRKSKKSIKSKLTKAAAKTAGVSHSSKSRQKRGAAAGRSVQKAKTTHSPIMLRNLLNELLPKQVAQNMGSPALNFRTGRFANSARVEMVLQGPRGGTQIDYTYMKEPYQTFEPGYKQGSTQRDPRKIIGASLREIAIGILGKQPHTIRSI